MSIKYDGKENYEKGIKDIKDKINNILDSVFSSQSCYNLLIREIKNNDIYSSVDITLREIPKPSLSSKEV